MVTGYVGNLYLLSIILKKNEKQCFPFTRTWRKEARNMKKQKRWRVNQLPILYNKWDMIDCLIYVTVRDEKVFDGYLKDDL